MNESSFDGYFALDPSRFPNFSGKEHTAFRRAFNDMKKSYEFSCDYSFYLDQFLNSSKPIDEDNFFKKHGFYFRDVPLPEVMSMAHMSIQSTEVDPKVEPIIGTDGYQSKTYKRYPYACEYVRKEWHKLRDVLFDGEFNQRDLYTMEYQGIVFDEMPIIYSFLETVTTYNNPEELERREKGFEANNKRKLTPLMLFVRKCGGNSMNELLGKYSNRSLQQGNIMFSQLLLSKILSLPNHKSTLSHQGKHLLY